MGSLEELVRQQAQMLQTMQQQLSLLSVQNTAGAATLSSRSVSVPWPAPLSIHIDPEEAFVSFKSSWQNYCRATEMDKWLPEQESRKVSILISALGEEALKKYNNFGIQESDSTCEDVLKVISLKMVPKKNVIYNRYIFNCRNQEEEIFDLFYGELTKLIDECNYGDIRDDLLRDKIVFGIKDLALKKELLKRDNLTLNDAVNLCRAAEVTERQMKTFTHSENVKKIQERKTEINTSRKCKFCGEVHIFKKSLCPAWGKTCRVCKGKNHSDKVCKKKKKVKQLQSHNTETQSSTSESEDSEVIKKIERKKKKKIRQLKSHNTETHSSTSESEDSEVIIKKITNGQKNMAECTLEYKFGNTWKDTKCLLDTAADDCLVGLKNLEKMLGKEYIRKNMRPSKKCLFAFGGNNIMIHGEIDMLLKAKVAGKNTKYQVTFQIVHTPHIPLLSCKACTKMGLVKFCKEVRCDNSETLNIIKKYDSVFNGQGSFSGEVNLEIDESVSPVIQKARRVPVALRQPLKEEIRRLEEQGIIIKEEKHTEWVSNILIVKKKDSFRICLDPIPLNKAIKRPNYQFTTIDEILPELGKAKVFTTLDVKKGFWHQKLSESSSKLTTFWTPFGKYRWKVLPFGISSSPDYFQMKMYEIVQGLSGVEVLVDDLLVYGVGETFEEATADHNKNLECLLQRLLENNCKLNKTKMRLLETSVKYYGHIFTDKGLQPDPSKIQDILNIPTPINKKELQRFLGVVTYLSRFIPNLSDKSTYLRLLTQDKTEWNWSKNADKEFRKLKSIISNEKTLKYFDKNKPLIIECDSSEAALGVAVFQDNQPVAYASRTLTKTEKRYAQIEKELLAIVFACKRFDQLIVGNPRTIIKTDHKPLLTIFKKPLLSAPKRLQSMLLILQRYQLELEFVSGKDNIMADALSRFYVDYEDIETGKDYKIFKILADINPVQDLPISSICLKEISDVSSTDDNYTKMRHYIREGWPQFIRDVPDALKQFYSLKDDLTVHENLILKKHAILVPEKYRHQILKKLHRAHSGLENTLKLARDAVFWPSMTTDIREMIRNCSICTKFAPSQQRLPMQSHEIPKYPFQIVSMDVFFYMQKGKQMKYLITVDHYSDFFEIDMLKDLSANSVINVCKKNFARHGVPDRVITDGGTNFVNQEFVKFSNDWNFIHVTSSPHHPQGNGKAEATVKIAKKLLLKSAEGQQDFWYSLLCLRNTPNKINSSPVQRIFSRRTRGCIPMIPALFEPKVITNVQDTIRRNKERIKYSYDKAARSPVSLEIGQPVSVQLQPATNKNWTPGKVTDILSDRSYLVNVNDALYRRDLSHIRPTSSQNTQSYHNTHQNDNIHNYSQLHDMTQAASSQVVSPTSHTPCLQNNLSSQEQSHTSDTPTTQQLLPNSDSPTSTKNMTSRSSIYNSPVSSRPKRIIKKPLYLDDYICDK